MKREHRLSDTSMRYLHALIELKEAFSRYTTAKYWFRGPSVESISEFARIVAGARTDFWNSAYKECPDLRFASANAAENGIVIWEDGKPEPEVKP